MGEALGYILKKGGHMWESGEVRWEVLAIVTLSLRKYQLSPAVEQDTPQNSGLQQVIISSPPAVLSR